MGHEILSEGLVRCMSIVTYLTWKQSTKLKNHQMTSKEFLESHFLGSPN